MLAAHLNLVPRLRMIGAIPSFTHTVYLHGVALKLVIGINKISHGL
jgi:hypothetical protein